MRVYLLSFGGGLLAGVLYGLLSIRSPAPPLVALVGLLGILLGEQAVPLARRLMSGEGALAAWLRHAGAPHLFGELPPAPRHDAPLPDAGAVRRPEDTA